MQYKQDLAAPNANLFATGARRRNSRAQTANGAAIPGLTSSLPEECIREIVLRLSDPKDVERVGDTCEVMRAVARERRVWRELVQTHYNPAQIEFVLKAKPELGQSKDWEALYKALRRKFGLKEEYTELIMLCRKCRILYWQSIGHPCLLENGDSSDGEDERLPPSGGAENKFEVPVTPSTFLSFFSL